MSKSSAKAKTEMVERRVARLLQPEQLVADNLDFDLRVAQHLLGLLQELLVSRRQRARARAAVHGDHVLRARLDLHSRARPSRIHFHSNKFMSHIQCNYYSIRQRRSVI